MRESGVRGSISEAAVRPSSSRSAYDVPCEEDFARHIVSECYDLERTMGGLERYFDYEAFARELFMYDYSMGANNNVFRNI